MSEHTTMCWVENKTAAMISLSRVDPAVVIMVSQVPGLQTNFEWWIMVDNVFSFHHTLMSLHLRVFCVE